MGMLRRSFRKFKTTRRMMEIIIFEINMVKMLNFKLYNL